MMAGVAYYWGTMNSAGNGGAESRQVDQETTLVREYSPSDAKVGRKDEAVDSGKQRESSGIRSKSNIQYPYDLTLAERDTLDQHPEAFGAQRLEFEGESSLNTVKAGRGIALWRTAKACVTGGDKVIINWMIPKASRVLFDEAAHGKKMFAATLYVALEGNSLMMTVMGLATDRFTKTQGTFEIQTPYNLKGRGIAHFIIKNGDAGSNILPLEIEYK
jgi:hypothetical protein